MKVLQLCCFTNHWPKSFIVDSYDLRLGNSIFDLDPENLPDYDIICASPPCDQFTKANALNWEINPLHYWTIVRSCLDLCYKTKKYWFLENPPGRIEKFFPELKKYRLITWQSPVSNKEYVIYGNFLIMDQYKNRYGQDSGSSHDNLSKKQREAWQPALIETIISNIN